MGTRWIARPGFPPWTPCPGGSSQAGFCPCTLRGVSVPPEPTFGPPRYLFKGVPPQPNCPPAVVPAPPGAGERRSREWAVFHWRLQGPRRGPFTASRLRSAPPTTSQRQAAVKLHGVFSSRWGQVDFSPPGGFAGSRAGTAGPSLIHSCTSELSGAANAGVLKRY